MKILKINSKGETHDILIDDDDFELISGYNWGIKRKYVVGRIKGGSHKRHNVSMHRLILNLTDPTIITDHINHNTFDNRRENLRICTSKENSRNKQKHKRNTTGYKGVYCEDFAYVANIGFERRLIRVGRFRNIEDAARAYDSAALHFFGEFAHLNFPDETPLPYSHYQKLSETSKEIAIARQTKFSDMLFKILDQFEMITPQLIKTFIEQNEVELTWEPQTREYCKQMLNRFVREGKLTTKERMTKIRSEPIVYIRP